MSDNLTPHFRPGARITFLIEDAIITCVVHSVRRRARSDEPATASPEPLPRGPLEPPAPCASGGCACGNVVIGGRVSTEAVETECECIVTGCQSRGV